MRRFASAFRFLERATGLSTHLGVRQNAGEESLGASGQPQVLLVSDQYALKAGDAEIVGEFRASAFMLAAGTSGESSMVSAPRVPA